MKLADRVVAVHTALEAAGIAHAFGGALALGVYLGDGDERISRLKALAPPG